MLWLEGVEDKVGRIDRFTTLADAIDNLRTERPASSLPEIVPTWQVDEWNTDPRVRLAVERTLLAYERTQIAWVRTALALISFGFAIAKFFAYVRESRGENATVLSPHTVGLLMIVIGLVGLILANWQHRRAIRALRKRYPELTAPVAGLMSAMIALLGVLALIGASLR